MRIVFDLCISEILCAVFGIEIAKINASVLYSTWFSPLCLELFVHGTCLIGAKQMGK